MEKRTLIRRQLNHGIARSPILIFLTTFAIVVVAGVSAMLLYTKHSEDTVTMSGEENREETEQEGEHVLDALWESIPEETVEEGNGAAGGKYDDILSDPEYMKANRIYEKQGKKEGVISFGFAGDILFDDEYAMMANLLRRGASIENGISEPLLAQMHDVDIMMVNNEFSYTNRGTPTEGKTYTFRADTSTVSYLNDMGVDIVSLANNHVYDFGETGLLDTLNTLEQAEMPYVGAGRNLEEAAAPVYFISGDVKVAMVSATQIERLDNPDTKEAGENSPGVFRCWNPEKLYGVVAAAEENSDFVIVYIHWGTENVTEPDWAQLAQAEGLAQAGADLIIGDHPHCLQGIQYYGDVPVFYSLGNFWFNSKTLDTGMVKADISKDGIESLQFVPAIQSDCRTDLAYGSDKERILTELNSISYGITIDGDGFITKN